MVAGLGIVQLLPPFPHVPWGRHVLGIPLIALGAIVLGAVGIWFHDFAMQWPPVPDSFPSRTLFAIVRGFLEGAAKARGLPPARG